MTTDRLGFESRHIGIKSEELARLSLMMGYDSPEDLVNTAIPAALRTGHQFCLPTALSEQEALGELKSNMSQNRPLRSFMGLGYYRSLMPSVIQRNILENPSWYTQYTPYQAEISQGRLEALFNFQTLVSNLTGLSVANSSLLDESTAAAEAMTMMLHDAKGANPSIAVVGEVFPQVKAVLTTRALGLGVALHWLGMEEKPHSSCVGVILQSPDYHGRCPNLGPLISNYKSQGLLVGVLCDPLALCLVEPPGKLGADLVFGSLQRFGLPLGYGGPHAGFISCPESSIRRLPGRLVGQSVDRNGKPAFRLALQTREQHIRRDRATSNLCTSQVLLAILSSMYAVYHGPDGLRKIAESCHKAASQLGSSLDNLGLSPIHTDFFDTIGFQCNGDLARQIQESLLTSGILCRQEGQRIYFSCDEATDEKSLQEIVDTVAKVMGKGTIKLCGPQAKHSKALVAQKRLSPLLDYPVFHLRNSETEILRYIKGLERKDLSLADSMIPLGSCTMKLNATSELLALSWDEVSSVHPLTPKPLAAGYQTIIGELSLWLAEIAGFAAVSLQPNSGAQGEYAGLMAIRGYLRQQGEEGRDICLIPASAHGTNPASAVMAGMKVVVVQCNERGDIDQEDLEIKLKNFGPRIAALMITYPSTHGVYEEDVDVICQRIHDVGGQVYLDGANLNAQLGYCRPGDYGVDVCHFNLHKTFCIPHGGGGPGVGPIGVRGHLVDFLPNHPLYETGGRLAAGPVAGAPYGSASLLTISWMFIRMMGGEGLKRATTAAVVAANYIAYRLHDAYPILYRGNHGLVAHECLINLRPIRKKTGVTVEDIAKRLMDYGFHAPTMAWPVADTMMIEPTESESLEEINRFCEAMLAIRREIEDIEKQRISITESPLRMAPHTAEDLAAEEWHRPYSRKQAIFPAAWCEGQKFWPSVARIDNAFGDRNLVCACAPMKHYQEDPSTL